MIWLTWRQFRVQAIAIFGALAVATVVLVIFRPTTTDDDATLYYGGMFALYLLPALIGVFWGVPTVARELETGTHNVAWNQTVTRSRWLAAKFLVPGAAAVAATALLTVAVGWWSSVIDTAADLSGSPEVLPRISPVVFAARGIAPIGYTLFALALGVLLGILLRRTVAAMAVTLVVFAAVQVAVPFLVRPYLVPAVDQTVAITADNIQSIHIDSRDGSLREGVVTVQLPDATWDLTNETVDANGAVPDRLPAGVVQCDPGPPREDSPPPPTRFGDLSSCLANELTAAGYQQHVVYHSLDHFWPLQWVETALFTAVAGLLAWISFRSLRRLS